MGVSLKSAWMLCPKHFWMEKKDVNWQKKCNKSPLPATTATRRTEILGEDVQSQLTADIKIAPCIGWIDESTDISDNAQLLVYVRFYHTERKDFCGDILGITALTTHTRGEDIQSYAKVWAPLITSITFIYKLLSVWIRNFFVTHIILHGHSDIRFIW